MSLGCYSSGGTWVAFDDGLTSEMASKIVGTLDISRRFNGFSIFRLTSGMTIESCTRVCLENSFLLSAIAGLGFILF